MKPHSLLLRSVALAAGLAGSAAWLISQSPELSIPADETLLRAMRDELQRSKQLAVVAGPGRALFFQLYSLTDAETLRISASMGAVVNVSRNRFRSPATEVRVGSYDFDNTGHIYSGIYSGSRYDGNWPLDDDYASFRTELWLSTDRAFKTAVESMARKRASLNNSAASSAEPLPDFSKVTPVVSIGKVSRPKVDDEAWTARAARLAAVFNNYKEVLSSGLELQLIQGPTTLMNSEGTAVRYNDDMYWLYAKAEGQAPDGMLLHDAVSIQSLELDKFPSEADMRKSLTEVGENVRALVKAPAGESYSGPVLLEPRAAAQLLAQLLGDNLRVPRRPLSDPGRNVPFAPSEFESRIGGRVLPDSFDVIDDATQSTYNGKTSRGILSVRHGGRAAQARERGGKRRLEEFLDHAAAHSRIPGVQRPRALARFLWSFRGGDRESVREIQRNNAAGGSEEAPDRYDQDARKTIRNVGAQARLSLFGRRVRSAIAGPGQRPIRRFRPAGEPAASDLPACIRTGARNWFAGCGSAV